MPSDRKISPNKESLFSSKTPHWFVMHVYKNEKKAEELLAMNMGLQYFIPKQHVLRTYHGKKVKIQVPVIPGIIFVYASHQQIINFKKLYNDLQYVTWKTAEGTIEYLIVPNKQMDDFIKVASCSEKEVVYFRPKEIEIRKGTPVRVHGGIFDGIEGIFVKVKGKRSRQIVILIEKITAIAVEVHPDLVEVL